MRILIVLHMCLALVVATVNGKVFKQCEGTARDVYIAGESGCRSFILCNGESSYESTCPIDTAFNPLDGTCDDPANVDCHDEFVQPTSGESKILCPSEDEIIFLPSPESCANYYMCYGGTPLALTCSNHLHFNAQKQSCDFPKLAHCKLPANTGSTQSATKIDPPTPTIVIETTPPLPASTTISNATTTRRTPPQPTATTTTSKASPQRTTTSPPPTTIPTTISADIGPPNPVTLLTEELCKQHWVGNFPFPEDCHFYYRCMNGLLSKQECPSGFGWDGSKKMCTTSGCSTVKT